MTSRERVLAAARRGRPDRVPRDISWGMSPGALQTFKANTGREDYLGYFGVDVRFISPAPGRNAPDYSRYHDDPRVTPDEWGIGHAPGSEGSHHFTHIVSPLRSATRVEQIADYPLPDLDAPYRYEATAAEIAAFHARGLAAAASAAVTIYEVGWQIRGLEETLTDMITGSEMVECLFDRLMHLRIGMIGNLLRAGCDLLLLGDDISGQTGMIMSPALWRRYLRPRMARIIEEARRVSPGIPVFYHSDGDCRAVLDELIEIGVTILNPVQPECMDPAEVHRRWGDRLAFWGTISVQKTLPFGTPEDVRREVKLRMDTVGREGGLLLGPSHMIEPEVPWENLQALYQAIDEYGVYQ
jgi:uroporphyrinogen decarboxylase